uniref:Uncharacterized protein n=1 Tax=Pithovirus LCPAC102 TaxID=2506587 RepID=A0A481Z3Y6_9VIRU|nr:MAG: hypothetical protein LCPAC102_00870 [Pithovirus LCPAC102]
MDLNKYIIHNDDRTLINYKLKTILLKRNIIEAIILSLLPTRLKIISYSELVKINSSKFKYIFIVKKFDYIQYDIFSDTENEKNKNDDINFNAYKQNIITNIQKLINQYIKCYYLKINISKNFEYEHNYYNINIRFQLSKNYNIESSTINIQKYIKYIHYSISLMDFTWGYSLKQEYPIIYNILCYKPGYTWKQYYESIKRLSWLDEYLTDPSKYIGVINSLLYYLAGIDEICLFDIVCKLHVNIENDNKYNKKYKSILDLRYELKREFINNIPNIDKVLFSIEWRIPIKKIHLLNSIHYLRIEYMICDINFTGDHIIGSIDNNNLDMFKYLLERINKNELNKNINRIIHVLNILKCKKNINDVYIIYDMLSIINKYDFGFKNGHKLGNLNYSEFDMNLNECYTMIDNLVCNDEFINCDDNLPPIIYLDSKFSK